ncbi:MAG TPA: hypothetical protein VFC46_00495, partial [Humisphaera sp.]|nr:hypothetical protein [Humisphaera sp.]
NLYGSTPEVFELTAPATRIVSYTLINADTGKAIQALQNGATLNLAQLPIDLNVVVQVQGKPLGSLLVGLDNQPKYRLTTMTPYALFGIKNGKYVHGTFTPGKHTLYSEGWLEPTAKTLLARGPTISFNVIG